MPIPRYYKGDTGIPFEEYWYCDKCHWAITTNGHSIGKDNCPICNYKTRLLKINYPGEAVYDYRLVEVNK